MTKRLPYLGAYSPGVHQQVVELLEQDRLGALLLSRYPKAHDVRSDKALFEYVAELKQRYLRNAGTVHKVQYDSKIHVVRNALGLHTSLSKAHGSRTVARSEIRVASIFKQTPEAFLRMIAVHELAHLREKNHDKPFYQLCEHMEPDYHRYELDVRLYLTHLEAGGPLLW